MSKIKRLDCTVRDKRGYNGDCMEVSPQGRYVTYSEYLKLKKKYDNLLIKSKESGL